MKKSYRLTIQAVLMAIALLITWGCVEGISDVLRNGEYNPGRPGFHVTALIGYFLWTPIPIVILGIFFRKLLCGLYALMASLYLIAFVVFWDIVLPTFHTLLTVSEISLILVPTMLLFVFLSALAIRTSTPKEGIMMRLKSYPGILAMIAVFGVACFSFHWLATGEDMRVASASFTARNHAYWENYDAALGQLDRVLQRYADTPPNTHRIDALIYRARLRRHVGDIEGYDRDMQTIITIAGEHEELAVYYRAAVERIKSNNRLNPISGSSIKLPEKD